MRPKNDRQREVVALSATLPPITEAQKRWAFEHCFAKKAFLCKRKAWCSCCGGIIDAHTVSPLIVTVCGEAIVCPHCGRRLKVENSRKLKHKEKWYYTILTTCHGYQVCRNYSVSRSIRRGEKPYNDIDEVVQNWITEDGHEEVIARPINALSGYYDSWATNKPMELRDAKRHDPYRPDKYHISGSWIYPSRRVLPLAKRNGYTGRNQTGIPEGEHVRLLLTDREAEMLEKNSQFSLLAWKYNRGYREFCLPYAHAIRVANRNKYLIKDASMWMDYIDLLAYFGYDTHNAHYVCPRNLKAEHDRLHKRKERIEAEKEEEEKRKQTAKWEADYKAKKGAYLGICFGNEDIVITVLQSVAEFAEEGKAMHHCVYSANYFRKPQTLILSAKTTDGKRLATIELSLRSYNVVQCRGVCNRQPDQYDTIMKLISDNINLFRKVA